MSRSNVIVLLIMNVKNYVMSKNVSRKNGNAVNNLVTLTNVIVIIHHTYVNKHVPIKNVKTNAD